MVAEVAHDYGTSDTPTALNSYTGVDIWREWFATCPGL
jgi:hypothetical protein